MMVTPWASHLLDGGVNTTVTGLESAQVRNEEAVKRHFRLSCVAQSLLQRVACSGGKSERFKFAQDRSLLFSREL